jgi:hypothetical protein
MAMAMAMAMDVILVIRKLSFRYITLFSHGYQLSQGEADLIEFTTVDM